MERGEVGMSSIDERIVQMKFENSNFEQNIKSSTDSLEKLKQSLNMDLAGKSIQDLENTGRKFSFSGMFSSFDALIDRVQVLNTVIGVTLAGALQKVMAMGGEFVKSLTIDPIMGGFSEYELKIGSIQTILANTSKYGTSLQDVNAALDQLNAYSDKTIYNFGQMTKNVGLFTNAGIKLEDAVSMIKGFSNASAASGVSAENAAGAAYQLSQALSNGTVRLMDWKSLTNVGLGSANMKQGLTDVAIAMGTLSQSAQTQTLDKFNESLKSGWLSADVMSKYLKIMAGDMTDAEMASLGLNSAAIKTLREQQKTAENAATKVKTYSQLVNTMKEAVESTWAESAQLVVGDFKQATNLFTKINNGFSRIVGASGDARNAILKDWAKYGGRQALIDGLIRAAQSLGEIIKTITDAFSEVFPAPTARQLIDATKGFKELMDRIKPSDKLLKDLKRTFRGLFSIFGIIFEVVKAVATALGDLFGEISKGGGGLFEFTGNIGDMIFNFHTALKEGKYLTQFFSNLVNIIKVPIIFIKDFVGALGAVVLGIGSLQSVLSSGVGKASENQASKIAAIGEVISQTWTNIVNAFKSTMDMFKPLIDYIAAIFAMIGLAIEGAFKGAGGSGGGGNGLKAILDIINTGLLGGIVVALFKFLNFFKNGGPFKGFNDFFGELTNTLKTFQQNIKANIILKIAIAVAIIAASAIALAMVDPVRLAAALGAITIMFAQLLGAFALFGKLLTEKDYFKLNLIANAMILLAIAIGILAGAVVQLSQLTWEQIAVGLTALSVIMASLIVVTKLVNSNLKGIIVAAFGLNLLSFAIKSLIGPIKELGQLKVSTITQGIIALYLIIGALIAFNRFASINKKTLGNAIAIVAVAYGIGLMVDSVERLGKMDIGVLLIGLGTMLTILAAIILFDRLTGSGKSLLQAAIGVTVLAVAIGLFAFSIKALADIDSFAIIKGLIAMVLLLTVIANGMSLMPPNMIATAAGLVITAVALNILANALAMLGSLTWEQVLKSFLVLATSLAVLAVALNLMVGTLPGSAALLVAALALNMLILPLTMFGKLGWEEIGKSLVFLAAALAIIAGAGYLLLGALPGLIGFGVAVLLIGAGGYLAALGIFLLSVAIGSLVVSLAAGGATLVLFISQMVNLIPFVAAKIAEGFVAFIKVIGLAAGEIAKTIGLLLIAVLNALKDVVPVLIDFVITALLQILEAIEDNISKVVETALLIIAGFIDGLTKGLPEVIEKGTDLIIAFMDGIGDNVPKLIDKGYEVILKLINGITKAIKKYLPKLKDAAAELGVAIADGMAFGLAGHGKNFIDNVVNLGNDSIDALKDKLGIKSPSKEFAKIGMYSAIGLSEGLSKNSGLVQTQAENIGTKAVNGLKNAISKISDVIMANIDVDPTIRPVLDLTSIKKDASLIDSLLSPSTLSIDSAYAQASSIAVAQKNNQAQELTSGQDVITNSDTNITFIQNNNSPKALSASEIYRQTKNQISAVKSITAV